MGYSEKDVEELLRYTINNKGTDLHICPGAYPFMRKDGELHRIAIGDNTQIKGNELRKMFDSFVEPDVKRIINEKKAHTFSFAINGLGRFRANVFTQRGTQAANIRILPFEIPTIAEVRMCANVLEFIAELDEVLPKKGLILVTGNQGTGKSTTTAALVSHVSNKKPCCIATIENPIEYLYSHNQGIITQKEVGVDSADFATALKWSMKADTDMIVMCDMPRSAENLMMAVTAAEEKLVIAMIETPTKTEKDSVLEYMKMLIIEAQDDTEATNLHNKRFEDALLGIINHRIEDKETSTGIEKWYKISFYCNKSND